MIVCITKAYERKINSRDPSDDDCSFEFDHAMKKNLLILPVILDKDMLDVKHAWKRKGLLKAKLGGILAVDMTEDDSEKFEEQINRFVVRLLKLHSS